jgi:hypothetical protein
VAFFEVFCLTVLDGFSGMEPRKEKKEVTHLDNLFDEI